MPREDRFNLDADDIEIVSRADEARPRTLLTPEAIREGQRRVAEGEDIDAVVADLVERDLL